jgi:hypothetical protein
LADFALISAKCTYENTLFLKIICAQGLSEAVFDENAHIKSDFFRVSYVRKKAPAIRIRLLKSLIVGGQQKPCFSPFQTTFQEPEKRRPREKTKIFAKSETIRVKTALL